MIKVVGTQLGNTVFSVVSEGRLKSRTIHLYDEYKSKAFICFLGWESDYSFL